MVLVAINTKEPSLSTFIEVDEGQHVRIGRKPETDPDSGELALKITWNDRLVSRNHCAAHRDGRRLKIERLPALPGHSKPNALFSNAKPQERELLPEPVELSPGEALTIGTSGSTALHWVEFENEIEAIAEACRQALEEEKSTYQSSELGQQDYDEVEQLDEYSLRLQLKLIQQELPEKVLSGWTSQEDLFTRASDFLEKALPGQKGVTAAFLAVKKSGEQTDFTLLNPDPLAIADFRPSRTLLNKIDLRKADPTKIYIWASQDNQKVFTADSLGDQIDWVAAVPVSLLDESASIYRDNGQPVYLYVETRQASETAAASFVPFLRLVSSLVASLLSAREEQLIQDRMSTYFSPGLRKVMRISDQSRLEPAMVDCTVMFADRRGHSRMLEVAKSDEEILDRLEENQKVVGLITGEVFDNNGVITDFAGDGALGLWGWPNFGASSQEHAINAVNAADAIVNRLANRVEYEAEHSRNMAAVRIGISTGRLAVGKTGPSQQWHISVFGSVANLGARLERIAKEFMIPVLISDETYCRIEGLTNHRFRKLCFIRPVGFEESYPIYEMILPKSVGGSGATPGDVKLYEQALEPFAACEWDECIQMLEVLPEDDAPSRWLRSKALAFRKNPPPPGWAGEVQSISK